MFINLSYCSIHNNASTKEYDELLRMSSRKNISRHFIPHKKDLSAITGIEIFFFSILLTGLGLSKKLRFILNQIFCQLFLIYHCLIHDIQSYINLFFPHIISNILYQIFLSLCMKNIVAFNNIIIQNPS